MDTAVSLPGRGLYVFGGDQVWRYTGARRVPDPGYPRPITAEFPGAFQRDVDAALLHPDGGLYLFRRNQHLRFNLDTGRPELGYPRPYAPDWPGVFPDRIDAAITWAPDIIYLFCGDAYTSFSPRRHHARPGYPKPIRGNWPGIPSGPVTSAFSVQGNRTVLVADAPYLVDTDGYPRTTPPIDLRRAGLGNGRRPVSAFDSAESHEVGFADRGGESSTDVDRSDKALSTTGVGRFPGAGHSESAPTIVERESTLVVRPFPIHASLPLTMDDSGLITCEESASRGANVGHLCAAVADLTGDPALPPFAAHNPNDMLYVGSLAKIYVMYVAFELKNRVEHRAKAMIADGLSTSSTGWETKVFAQLKTEWQPELNAAFPRLPRGFPKLSDILQLSGAGDASFTENTPPLTDADLDAIGEFGAPRGKFRDWMRLMMRWSNNAAASKCILALSYPYLNGVLGSAGFFEKTSKTGLWISGDYMGHDWLPGNAAGQALTPRWAKLQKRGTTNFAGTAFQVARLVTLLAQGNLVNAASSADMLLITTGSAGIGSYIQSALSSAHKMFLGISSKIGFGDDSVSHDCAFVRVNDGGGDPAKAVSYVVVVLGSPPANDRVDLETLTVAYHDCILSRHP
jgi:Hemopexin/Beta-lactamase enzyme family